MKKSEVDRVDRIVRRVAKACAVACCDGRLQTLSASSISSDAEVDDSLVDLEEIPYFIVESSTWKIFDAMKVSWRTLATASAVHVYHTTADVGVIIETPGTVFSNTVSNPLVSAKSDVAAKFYRTPVKALRGILVDVIAWMPDIRIWVPPV
eukprot:GHVU01067058.1.p1 GENE.GHVU01067058.1~~GHVU01067058.1.p1  ORF type:complete len:151 (-),score=20.77 GHVU01067058.1:679-1131(-)